MRGEVFVALVAVVFAALPAHAAGVSIVPADGTLKGNVFVNQGKGFEPVTVAVQARAGDSVMAYMAYKGGRAKIVYPDGCAVEVNSTTAVVYVQATSPCKVQVAATQTTGALSVGTYAVGAAIVGGVGAAVILLANGGSDNNGSSHEHSHPASP
jgi:hypothetical protein